MRIYVQLVENYLKQEIPTIILSTDRQKYIFNMPTCFQRFIKVHRQKFPKGSVIFFTKTNTETLAGLSGFMLTIFDSKMCQDTKLYLGDELYHYMEQVRYKMGFKILPYSYSNLFTAETRTGVKYVDKVLELLNRGNYPELFLNSEKYIETELLPEEKNESRKYLNANNEYQDDEVKIVPFQIVAKGQKIFNYICIFKKLDGKVLPQKIKELKVPPKLISKLLAQGFLTRSDGTTIRAEDIKEPDSPSPNLLILHHNSVQALVQTMKHPVFGAYMTNPENSTESVIHIAENNQSEGILGSDEYRQLVSLFAPAVKHLVYNRGYTNKDYSVMQEPISQHLELVSFVHKYYPTCMPDILHQHYNYVNHYLAKHMRIWEEAFPDRLMYCYKRCYQLVLAPKKSQGYWPIADSGQAEKVKKDYIAPEKINGAELEHGVPEYCNGFKDMDPHVVFLGTGSMKPSKYRNVSSIYVEMVENHGVLLDCGEGTYYQLYNHFGFVDIDRVLLSTKVIFITHIHSDHSLGILDLVAQRNRLLRLKYGRKDCTEEQYQERIRMEKLFLIMPYNVLPWFHAFVSHVENLTEGCDILFVQTLLGEELDLSTATISKDDKMTKIDRRDSEMSEMRDEREQSAEGEQCEQPNAEIQAYYSPQMKKLLAAYGPSQTPILQRFKQYLEHTGIAEFLPVHVDHCPQSFGVVVTHKSGIKVSYSGDCRPSEEFVKAAYKSTLLIHEATFGDDLLQNAKQNMHSTVGEAIDVALRSESWKLALTHFSQRYVSAKEIVNPSLYKLDPVKMNYALKHSVVCFDHLRMRMSELPLLAVESKRICQIFPNDSQE